MKTILFDTETTGLLKPDPCRLEDQPYITEFYGVKIDDDSFEIIEECNLLVRPPIPISAEITRITGIDDELLNKNDAAPFSECFERIQWFFFGVEKMVAHNLAFDKGMLQVEMKRMEMDTFFPWPPNQLCTVEATMNIEQRRMNLGALHNYLTGKPHTSAHRAKPDVFALVRCYHALKEKKLI
jgi:DNA polymerase III alpha subunit (gram-positive type)